MNRKYKISTSKWLRSLILLMMMGWMGSAWAQDAATNIATGNKGNVYFDYNGIRVNGEPEKDKTYHITFNAGEHASGTSPEATATWNFTKDNDAPTINYQKTAGILVTQLEIKADETEETYRMDVKIDLDATATKSKFDN